MARAARRARLHRPRRHREVRGLLPRPRRLPARQGGQRRGDVRRPRLGGRPRGHRGEHGHAPVQRRGRAARALRGARRRRSPRSSSSRSSATWASCRPAPGFLEAIVDECAKHGAVSIFDEVMTGCRVARGGMQERAGLAPGHDLPRQDRRRRHAARGLRRQARDHGEGRAARARLPGGHAEREPGRRERGARDCSSASTTRSTRGSRRSAPGSRRGSTRAIAARGAKACVQRVGSMITLFFTPRPRALVGRREGVRHEGTSRRWHGGLLERGVYWPPSQFEAAFIGARAHRGGHRRDREGGAGVSRAHRPR